MKILYITNPVEDYLSDSLLIGLKSIADLTVVDFPENRFIYESNDFKERSKHIYGNGFTLYNLLESTKKTNLSFERIAPETFDFFIFSSIHRQKHWYFLLLPYLNSNNTLIVDGEDSGRLIGNDWRSIINLCNWSLRKSYKKFYYLKREITPETNFNRFLKIIPKSFTNHFPLPIKVYPINFSIPRSKIINELPRKTKDFPCHIVDPEVQQQISYSSLKYAFANEQEYYTDLQGSRFGITTKRAGWDCMRHYEIAANGAVICFRDLDKKPKLCAPHGLIDGENCISYTDFADLKNKIQKLSPSDYHKIQKSCLAWAMANTCEVVSKTVLDKYITRRVNK